MTVSAGRARVVILGGGFAGIGAARMLKKAEADVVLVHAHDYQTLQPLLYQVATDLLEMSAVGHPPRDLFHEQPNVVVDQARVAGVDLGRREVMFGRLLEGKETEPFGYHDKGATATIGRAAAVVQFRGGRTMEGKMAALASGTVHLALLSTREDRAKAVLDRTWAGVTHERSSRIVVEPSSSER